MSWFVQAVVTSIINFFVDTFTRWQTSMKLQQQDQVVTQQNTQELQSAQTKEEREKVNSDMAGTLGR